MGKPFIEPETSMMKTYSRGGTATEAKRCGGSTMHRKTFSSWPWYQEDAGFDPLIGELIAQDDVAVGGPGGVGRSSSFAAGGAGA